MLRLKDVLPGECWKFASGDDKKPTFVARTDERPHDLPLDWDWIGPIGVKSCTDYVKRHGERDVELLEPYEKSPSGRPLALRRRDLKPGDCFQYIEEDCPNLPTIVDGLDVRLAGMPGSWLVSSARSAETRMDDLVRRVPHWTVDPRVIETSPCGEFVLMHGRDLPPDAPRSSGNSTLFQARTYREKDCSIVRTGVYCGAALDGRALYWTLASALKPAAQPAAGDDPRVRATSKCGEYAVVARTDVPPDARRSHSSSSVAVALRDEVQDIASIATGARGPKGDAMGASWFCWVALADLGVPPGPDPRVLHDFGDGTGIVEIGEIGRTQERSDAYGSLALAVKCLAPNNKEGQIGRHVGTGGIKAAWTRVRVAELPPKRAGTAEPAAPTTPAAPVVLPCVDPLKHLRDAIFVREETTIDSLKGKECLHRFEMGQRSESIAKTGEGYFCTHADYALDARQVLAARELWSYKLQLRAAEAKLAEAASAERDRMSVTVEDQDEMPNMVYVSETP